MRIAGSRRLSPRSLFAAIAKPSFPRSRKFYGGERSQLVCHRVANYRYPVKLREKRNEKLSVNFSVLATSYQPLVGQTYRLRGNKISREMQMEEARDVNVSRFFGSPIRLDFVERYARNPNESITVDHFGSAKRFNN